MSTSPSKGAHDTAQVLRDWLLLTEDPVGALEGLFLLEPKWLVGVLGANQDAFRGATRIAGPWVPGASPSGGRHTTWGRFDMLRPEKTKQPLCTVQSITTVDPREGLRGVLRYRMVLDCYNVVLGDADSLSDAYRLLDQALLDGTHGPPWHLWGWTEAQLPGEKS